MTDRPEILVFIGLAGAALSWLVMTFPELRHGGYLWSRVRKRLIGVMGVETARIALVQADLDWLAVRLWLGVRLGLSITTCVLTFALFHLWVLAGLSIIASYYLAGLALEFRRRGVQLARQRALLDAIRYGAAVMSRSGNLLQMLTALAEHGPWQVRRLFRQIVDNVHGSRGETTLTYAIQAVQQQFADPMIDDVALALVLHERQGSRLVPALETLASDWDQTLALQREAKALRAGVEASVLILTLLPFVFLVILESLAPALLEPFRSPLGELLFGGAVVWMVVGYRVLHQMAAPPAEERVSLRLETEP
jgi:Flp pilus assembly protein TadB